MIEIEQVRGLMETAWRAPGFCVPNASVYPFQWLWDSCFHAIVWAAVGDDRAVTELDAVFAHQDPTSGFVPHLTYWSVPDHHADFWGRSATSSITQPPMYGHATAVLAEHGHAIDDRRWERCRQGLRALLARRGDSPLVPVFHPWETGCDDAPRWDAWNSPDHATDRRATWRVAKGELVSALVTDRHGFAVGSDRFVVESCGFNALVAWNIAELERCGQADGDLVGAADAIVEALGDRWDPDRITWVDRSLVGPDHSAGARSADALLVALVDPRPEALASLVDPAAHGGRFGVRGVHPAEPTYDPDVYWRGPAWPQLDYLLWRAAGQAGAVDVATAVADAAVTGAIESGWAEYRHPDTGTGGGATPQTWTALAFVVDRARRPGGSAAGAAIRP